MKKSTSIGRSVGRPVTTIPGRTQDRGRISSIILSVHLHFSGVLQRDYRDGRRYLYILSFRILSYSEVAMGHFPFSPSAVWVTICCDSIHSRCISNIETSHKKWAHTRTDDIEHDDDSIAMWWCKRDMESERRFAGFVEREVCFWFARRKRTLLLSSIALLVEIH